MVANGASELFIEVFEERGVTHTIDDGTLYSLSVSQIRLAFASAMPAICSPLELNSAIGSGDFHIIQEYVKPIPR